jgi:DNA-binding transcriptional MerR regulator
MGAHEADRGPVRIGELSRRVGVTPEVLRAWERRYGIPSPTRTDGGFRLYGGDDERRVRRMLQNLEQGLSAAEAARLARAEPPARLDTAAEGDDGSGAPTAAELGEELRRALDEFDDVGAHSVLDRLLGSYPLESVLRDAVLPYLHDLGERWAHAETSVAQEHFASALLRGRLLALARGWGRGRGPHALLACIPGDQHDLGLICFGLALRAHGWRITYLGADTPLPTLIETADLLQPSLVVVSATLAELAQSALGGLRELACVAPVALAGGGTDASLADTIGARWLNEDPVAAAASTAAPRGDATA